MAKNLLFFVILLAGLSMLTGSSNSQTIFFCENYTDNGKPVGDYDSFTIKNEGDYVWTLVNLPREVACYSVRYEIYRNGEYDNTVYIDTEKDWVWFAKKINFYKTGRYTFYVYDCFDYMLTSGSVKIDWK